MELLKGKELSQKIRQKIADEITWQKEKGNRAPGLVFIRVGEGPDSAAYLRSISRLAEKAGFNFTGKEVSSEISEKELIQLIQSYNDDDTIDGIMLSQPLPKHMDAYKVVNTIDPDKDAESQTVANAGKLLLGRANILPCTPEAVHQILLDSKCELDGKHCVVLGRSNILGKPMALIMLQENCTVTVCHSHTENLPEIASKADILISCMGRTKMVDSSYTNPDQVVIDVAMNVDEEGKLCGDIDFEDVADKVAAITPVPGGVGPVTNAILMQNTMVAYHAKIK